MQKRAFWDCWKTDVKLYCAWCKACNEFYRSHVPKRQRAGLKPLFAGAPMEVLHVVLHVDLTGPHATSQGYRYIMTVAIRLLALLLLHLCVTRPP